jgi:hypothetical protein
MTEAEWLLGTDPHRMLEYLRGRASERKLRLFACACVRWLWPVCDDPRSRRAVVVAVVVAEGRAGLADRAAARDAADEAVRLPGPGSTDLGSPLRRAACAAADLDAFRAASTALAPLQFMHCALLREVVGNPFRPAVVAPEWRTANGGAAAKLARVIHEERRFGDLPILADALEDAGCTDAELLGHLRGAGPHVRGCHVLDLLLDKPRG